MTNFKSRFLLQYNGQFHLWRRALIAVSVPTLVLRSIESPEGAAALSVLLPSLVLLTGVFPRLLPRRTREITDWAYVCLESLLASLLPGIAYAFWAPIAFIPYLLDRALFRQALVSASCLAVALLGNHAWSLLGSGEGIRFSEATVVVLSVLVSFMLSMYLKSWKEREILQRRELSNRLESRDSMVSTLAHEVKTPLTVLQTSCAVLLEERPGKLSRDQARLVRQIDNGVIRLIHFADNLIASIKVDQKWFPLDREFVDLRRIIKGVAEQTRPLLSQREQRLKLSFPSLLSKVPGDRQWLEQVMVNLVHNAAKYADPAAVIDVSVRENEQWIVCSIGDNGIGISGDERFQVFTEFYQGGSQGPAQLNGSGLGLAIVKRVVERHGGEVFVGSVESIGTIISFTLPKSYSAEIGGAQ